MKPVHKEAHRLHVFLLLRHGKKLFQCFPIRFHSLKKSSQAPVILLLRQNPGRLHKMLPDVGKIMFFRLFAQFHRKKKPSQRHLQDHAFLLPGFCIREKFIIFPDVKTVPGKTVPVTKAAPVDVIFQNPGRSVLHTLLEKFREPENAFQALFFPVHPDCLRKLRLLQD